MSKKVVNGALRKKQLSSLHLIKQWVGLSSLRTFFPIIMSKTIWKNLFRAYFGERARPPLTHQRRFEKDFQCYEGGRFRPFCFFTNFAQLTMIVIGQNVKKPNIFTKNPWMGQTGYLTLYGMSQGINLKKLVKIYAGEFTTEIQVQSAHTSS